MAWIESDQLRSTYAGMVESVVHAEQGDQEIRCPQNLARYLDWIIVHIIMQSYYLDQCFSNAFYVER